MAAPQPEHQGDTAPAKKFTFAGLTAEATITLALLGVGLIVAGAWWLLQLREDAAPVAASSETAVEAAPAPAGETAAPVQWQTALEGKVEELQQLRRAEQERSEAERRRAIEEQQAKAAAAAEAQRRAAEQEKLAAAARAAPPPVTPAIAAAAAPGAAKADPTVPAKVDWKSCRQPAYPPSSLRRKEEGVVIMAFQINPAGKVIEKRIDKSSGSTRLDLAALQGIALCSFTPGTSNGVPVASWAMMRFVWKLED